MRSWLSSRLFWTVLLGALALSAGSKGFINLAIEPLTFDGSMRTLEGQTYPYPPGRLAITHSQHLASSGPDNLIIIGWAIIVVYLFLATARRAIHTRNAYIGAGLFLAGVISNRGEVALFGHATDFLLIWPRESTQLGAIVNFADIMVVTGLALLLVWSPLYRLLKSNRCPRAKEAEPEIGS